MSLPGLPGGEPVRNHGILGSITAHTTDAGGTLTVDALFKAMNALVAPPEPPPLSRLYASHTVPYGAMFRMYTTRGELIAYVNRGWIADLPRAAEPFDFAAVSSIAPPGLLGVPVYNE